MKCVDNLTFSFDKFSGEQKSTITQEDLYMFHNFDIGVKPQNITPEDVFKPPEKNTLLCLWGTDGPIYLTYFGAKWSSAKQVSKLVEC